MRKFAPPIICLLVLFAVYSRPGHTQNKHKPVTRATPKPTPKVDDDDFWASIPDATPTPEPPSEWQLILYQKNDSAWFYNMRRINHSAPNVVKVWIKRQLFREARKKYIREMGESGSDYKGYAYSLVLEEYDCKGFRRRLLEVIEYTLLDEVIDSTEMKGEWKNVVPESTGEAILEAVCREKT
jgi:hypothetical protein